MKRRFIHTLLFFAFSIFISAEVAYAQDAGFPSDSNYPSNDEKVIYSPGGEGDHIMSTSKPVSTVTPVKDSISIRQSPRINPAAEPTKVNKQAPADDSVLSFNFLYYIIRKYKLQDIID